MQTAYEIAARTLSLTCTAMAVFAFCGGRFRTGFIAATFAVANALIFW